MSKSIDLQKNEKKRKVATKGCSKSDLAQFVASVMRDKTLTDLNTEIEELRKERDERLLVEVTGPDGTPVYYQASMKDGINSDYNDDGNITWLVQFEQQKNGEGDDIVLPLVESIEGLEFRLGGIVALKMNRLQIFCKLLCLGTNKTKPKMGGVIFHEGYRSETETVCAISGKIGPILFDDCRALNGININELKAVAHDNGQAQDLIITSVEFTKTKINGIISLLERMGISTDGGGLNIDDNNW
eukprot:CAMPEP_0170837402 /NCGR_PEP_ID=MMETSP0734-20130129/2731_1 /TAXON_ID=186038 /ORGANISM="Fragilariopsis kerguelensis, Strain L26-C5" /LENGTH=243 /DNA_ID=CAMNT_0011204553 /DNA_START=48 /DNA_END=779 /DNA_ORIENTATION=+